MGKEVLDGDARHEMEETKVLLDVAGLRISGYEADDYLDADTRSRWASATSATCWPRSRSATAAATPTR